VGSDLLLQPGCRVAVSAGTDLGFGAVMSNDMMVVGLVLMLLIVKVLLFPGVPRRVGSCILRLNILP
jgi:hypothetical protein